MKKQHRRLKPAIDRLEAREVPASLLALWPDPQHLTISFPADGVKMGNQLNASNAALNAQFGTTTSHAWQREILRAAQTWEAVTNVNIGVVSDGGQDFGVGGAPQGDTRFGDIRVGAHPMSPGVLGVTQPPTLVSGTWGGDITINSSASLGGGSGTDLYTVALHEMGHALGLDDNASDVNSAMYNTYLGPRAGIDPADVAAIQALYGVRTPELVSNDTLATASPIAYDANFGSAKVQTVSASIATPVDLDYYSFYVPSGYASMSVRLQTSGISALLGQVSVYDKAYNLVGSARATDPLAGDVSVALSGLKANETYFVKVEGASPDALGTGAYHLQLDYRASGPVAGTTGYTWFSFLSGLGSLSAATPLAPSDPATDPRFQYTYKASISQVNQVNYYQVSRPANAPAGCVLTATTWGMDVNGVSPLVSVYDSLRRPIAATVLFNEGGTFTVQVANAVDSTYYIGVQAQGSQALADNNQGSTANLGNYFLGVDFGNPPTTLDAKGSGTVSRGVDGTNVAIAAPHDDLFHFALTGSASTSTKTNVVMTIYDAQGRSVATMKAGYQQTRTLTVFLPAGTYTARFTYLGVFSQDTNRWSSALNYSLTGADLSDPIRVYSAPTSGATPIR